MKAEDLPTDVLTGFLHRKSILEMLQQALAQSSARETPLSLALLDLDSFKEVNDHYGHVMGDAVLVSVAEKIRQIGGEGMVAGRYGGDEFALLFPLTEREQAFLAVEAIRAAVARPESYQAGDRRIQAQLSLSGGIASFPLDGRTEDDLLRSAEQALYRAKQGGRNKIRLSYEEKMVPKTTHFTQTQLERLSKLAAEEGVSEAVLLREALDDLLRKYKVTVIER